MAEKKPTDGVNYYGDNIKCDSDPNNYKTMNLRCKGYILNQTQHYGYKVVAKHMLAMCYYGLNHGEEKVFSDYKKYLNCYCKSLITPTKESIFE